MERSLDLVHSPAERPSNGRPDRALHGWPESAVALLAAGIPEATRAAYRTDRACWAVFADQTGVPVLPPDPESLALWAAELLLVGSRTAYDPVPLKVSTVRRRLSAVAVWARERGYERPDLRPAHLVLRGHTRQNPSAPRRAAPITVEPLRLLLAQADLVPDGPDSHRAARDRALLTLGFALAARRSELVRLHVGDITGTTSGLLVRLRRLKTTDHAQTVAVPWAEDRTVCAVRATVHLRIKLAQAGYADGPLFRHVRRGDRVQAAALTPSAVTRIVHRHADAIGLPLPEDFATWSAHGLRRGLATAARANGADALKIARHGGWVDGSTTLNAYLADIDRWTDSPLNGLV
jgi:integrase